jgi:hypothetical protein
MRLVMFARIRKPIHALIAALATLASAAGAFSGDAAGSSHVSDTSLRFESALDQYERGHYGMAFDEFAALADCGHCEAARVAIQMVRYGRALYAIPFAVVPERLEQWKRLNGCSAVAASTR